MNLLRAQKLIRILKDSKYPVSKSRLEEELEIGRSALFQCIKTLREEYGAPIITERERGYTLQDNTWELPGLWFESDELVALLSIQKIISNQQNHILPPLLIQFETKIKQLLAGQGVDDKTLETLIKIVPHAQRKLNPDYFKKITEALINTQTLHIDYQTLDQKTYQEVITHRTISPQRLCRYRDNWYLDAFCHLRQTLRTFRIEQIQQLETTDTPFHNVSQEALDEHVTASYGIFTGQKTKTAILQFELPHAHWVSNEIWHPDQIGQWLNEKVYQLELPFQFSHELEMDIMRYLPHVKVIQPESLKHNITKKIEKSLIIFQSPVSVD